MSELWHSVGALQDSQLSERRVLEASGVTNAPPARNEPVLALVERVVTQLVESISRGQSPQLQFYNRSTWENIHYNTTSGGHELRTDAQVTAVRFDAVNSVTRLSLMLKILAIIYKLVQTGTYSTKRDIYYQDCSLFGSQSVVDGIVDDLACMLGVPRWELNVMVTSKGCVAGDLSYEEQDGSYVNCSGSNNGILISNNVRGLRNLRTNARVVLIVEKDATFQKLLDDGLITKLYPIIVLTGKGFPDVNTRLMARRLWDEFHLPTLGLVDADPHGVEILSVYKYGSMSLAFEASHLIVPSIRWLGILPSDVKRFSVPVTSLQNLTDTDTDKALSLLDRPGIATNPAWTREINQMLVLGMKAEIQSLAAIKDDYLTNVYLPNKIRYGGWV